MSFDQYFPDTHSNSDTAFTGTEHGTLVSNILALNSDKGLQAPKIIRHILLALPLHPGNNDKIKGKNLSHFLHV